MIEVQNTNVFDSSPITYYTHLSDEVVVSPSCVYINGRCVFRIREPNDEVRGIRSCVGIYDSTVTPNEVEQLIRPKCGKVFEDNH